MNPLVDLPGNPKHPVDEAAEKVYSRRIDKYEKDVRREEFRQRHPLLGWCKDGCWDMVKNIVGVLVGFVTLMGAIYSTSRYIGWPDLISGKELTRAITDLNEKMVRYFTNLQRMAWVNRIELLENRRAARKRDRQEWQAAIDLHTKELERPDVDNFDRQQLNFRIQTLKGQIEESDREDHADRQEQARYARLLQQSDAGPVTPLNLPPPPPDMSRFYDGK